jgi:hypothetical protein
MAATSVSSPLLVTEQRFEIYSAMISDLIELAVPEH